MSYHLGRKKTGENGGIGFHWNGKELTQPKWLLFFDMASITLKDIPEDLHERFRKRAARNRRSLQAEILNVMANAEFDFAEEEKMDLDELIGVVNYTGPSFSVEEMDSELEKMVHKTWKK